MGLKSSSAVAISAIKSVIDEFGIDLNPRQIVEVAAEMQMRSGCSMTGSYDDNCCDGLEFCNNPIRIRTTIKAVCPH